MAEPIYIIRNGKKERFDRTTRFIGDFIEQFLRVEDRQTGATIDFKLNGVQRKLLDNLGLWNIVLKARQPGVSTLVEAIFLVECLTVPNTHAVVISHEEKATQRLLKRVYFMLNNLKTEAKPYLNTENKNEIGFANNSTFYIGTAGGRAFGRGDTITHFHGSEVAYWPTKENATPESLWNGLRPCFTPNAMVFLESTANGEGDLFHEMWKRAEAGQNRMRPHFFSPKDIPEYSIPAPADFKPDFEETVIQKRHDLTNAQMFWRRTVLSELADENKDSKDAIVPKDAFRRDYPYTPEEAFLTSGIRPFDAEKLAEIEKKTTSPLTRCDLIMEHGIVRIKPSDAGFVRIWKPPIRNHVYIVGADVAEGLEDGDFSSAHVIDVYTGEVAATFHGKCPPDEFGDHLMAMGWHYNTALLAPETNNTMGGITIQRLQEERYPRIYVYRRFSRVHEKETDYLGWRTDARTRTAIITELAAAVRNLQLIIYDADTIAEMREFRRKRDGRYDHPSYGYSDRVFSLAIANFIARRTPVDNTVVNSIWASDVVDTRFLRLPKREYAGAQVLGGKSGYGI